MADDVVPMSTSIFPLRLEDVSYVVDGRAIIDRVSLTVEAGSRTIILGSNGAGKSVLMRLCHGLLEPTSGRITWNRAERPGERRRQAMVFQRQVMLRRSALGNIAYALKLALTGETYAVGDRSRHRDIAIGVLATVYGLWLIYAAGLQYLLMCAVLFAPGIVVYIQARREQDQRAFTGVEVVIAFVIAALAVFAARLMWTGRISPL